MKIKLLGRPEVWHEGRRIDIGPRRPVTVLAALALAAGHPVSVERLRDALAGEGNMPGPTVIRVYITDLRRILPRGAIETVSAGYRLRVEPEDVDAELFQRLLERRELDAGLRAQSLSEALALWRGPALDDVRSDFLQRTYAEPLNQLRDRAAEELCEARIELREHRLVLTDLRMLIEANPLSEHRYELLMIALYRSGNVGEALACYERLRRVLAEELGLDPSPKLRKLHERILRGDPSLGEDAVPTPAELPRDDRAFVGRQRLLRDLTVTLTKTDPAPAIVLYGHTGVGKSTLAVRLAWQCRSRFPDGQLFEELSAKADLGSVLARFLRALGYPGGSIPATLDERIRAYHSLTADRRLLVVLDNASDEDQVRCLMPTGPQSAVLVTSWSPLPGLGDVDRYEVKTMTRDESYELLNRLGGRSRMTADRDATEELLNICAGLPIALSIVGSRLASGRDDSARPLLRQLHGSPLDGFRAGDKAVSSLFGLAYDGLDDDTKSLLRSLAQLSASNFAEWVAAPLTGGAAVSLASIADHGLLQRLATDEAGQERFRMHGLTRHYVRERVELTENALPRLAASAVSRVQAAVLPYTSEGSDFRGVPDVLSMETTDIRFSASWLDGELSFLVSLVTDLTDFPHHVWRLAHLLTAYLERGLHLDEWEMVNRQALAASRAARENAGVALTLRDQGDLLRAKRDLDAAAISYQKSIGHFLRDGSEQDRARVLLRLGLVYLEQGKLRPAEENVAHAGRGFKACGDQRGEAECLRVRGMARYRDGDLETSLFSLLAALRLARNLGDRYTQASCLQELVIVQLARHEHGHAKSLAEAEMHAEQEHDLAAHRLRDPKLTAYALLSLARVAQVRQEAEAAQYAGDAATRLLNTGDILGHAWALTLLGDITGRLAEHERAHAIFSRLGDVHGMARTAPPRADGDEHA